MWGMIYHSSDEYLLDSFITLSVTHTANILEKHALRLCKLFNQVYRNPIEEAGVVNDIAWFPRQHQKVPQEVM